MKTDAVTDKLKRRQSLTPLLLFVRERATSMQCSIILPWLGQAITQSTSFIWKSRVRSALSSSWMKVQCIVDDESFQSNSAGISNSRCKCFWPIFMLLGKNAWCFPGPGGTTYCSNHLWKLCAVLRIIQFAGNGIIQFAGNGGFSVVLHRVTGIQ